MAYNYNVKLEIANDKEREGFDFNDIEEEIKGAIEKYHGLNTVRNKKTLSYKISPKILEISISSPVKLDVPSKALAKFTRILIGLSPKLAATITNGRVFQSVQISVPVSDMDSFSSSETLKKLIDIFCDDLISEDTQKKNDRLEIQRKIKKIIFNIQ
jgi:hypothetical protein